MKTEFLIVSPRSMHRDILTYFFFFGSVMAERSMLMIDVDVLAKAKSGSLLLFKRTHSHSHTHTHSLTTEVDCVSLALFEHRVNFNIFYFTTKPNQTNPILPFSLHFLSVILLFKSNWLIQVSLALIEFSYGNQASF